MHATGEVSPTECGDNRRPSPVVAIIVDNNSVRSLHRNITHMYIIVWGNPTVKVHIFACKNIHITRDGYCIR